MKKLFISDLDGTLLNSEGKLTQFSKSELNRMLDQGLQFTVATARSPLIAMHLLNGLNLRLPIICYNGAITHNHITNEHAYVIATNTELILQAREISLKHQISPMFAGVIAGKDYLYIEQPENEAVKRYRIARTIKDDPRLAPIDFKDFMAGDVISMNAINREELIRKAAQEIKGLSKDINVLVYPDSYFKGWWWMTVSSSHVSKGLAVQRLAEKLNTCSENIHVFGDHENDLSMFAIAHNKIAVSNAIRAVRNAATKIIGRNDENSVVRYVAEEFVEEGFGCNSMQADKLCI